MYVVLFFIFTNYIHHFCICPHSKTLGPTPTSNYPIKKLNKKNKNIHNVDCMLVKKNYFITKEPKKQCVIGEIKTKFFATTVNWYKFQLTVASC